MPVVDRSERRNGVDHVEGRMAGGIDGAAQVADAGGNPGRGFVVHYAYRLEALPGVGAQALLDRVRIGAVAPVGRQEFDLQPELRRHLLPQAGEVARFGHQHAIAGRQAVHQGSFPRAGAGGEVMFDAASRGRYSTDASIYQIEPLGVVVPRTEEAARTALAIALEAGMPVLPRGAGTSQCGQAVGEALVIDHTKYLNKILEVNADAATAVVQPGVVLDALNAVLRPQQLWFPVDVSTSAQATIGGMAGNNSSGPRSLPYRHLVHNVLPIDALTPTGELRRFGPMRQT